MINQRLYILIESLPHFQKDIPNLFPYFQQRMEGTALRRDTFRLEIVFFE
jgi:hypothetical protein